MKIYITKYNNYDFIGYVYESELTDKQLELLNMKRHPQLDREIRAIGEFEVSGNGFYGVGVDSIDVTLYNETSDDHIYLDVDEYDYDATLSDVEDNIDQRFHIIDLVCDEADIENDSLKDS